MVPTWSQLFRRIVAIWRQRKLQFRICTECGIPLLDTEGLPGVASGRCDDCHELLWVLPQKERQAQAGAQPGLEQMYAMNAAMYADWRTGIQQQQMGYDALKQQRMMQAQQNIQSQLQQSQLGNLAGQIGGLQGSIGGLSGLLGQLGLPQPKKPD